MQESFASHLNAHLGGDLFLEHLLPLDPKGADLFKKFHDGVLMCRLVCLAIPGAIGRSLGTKCQLVVHRTYRIFVIAFIR